MRTTHAIKTDLKLSNVLAEIKDETRLPKEDVICAFCPKAIWFISPTNVKSFCGKMHIITWSTNDPGDITDCDGAIAEKEE